MRISDLALVRTLGEPTLAADGRQAAVAVGWLDLEADAYRSQIFMAPTDGVEPPTPFTNGPRDSSPRFSPDGRQLAFLRVAVDTDGSSAHPQLYVMPARGGEPRQVCEHPLGVADIAWSPDSRRIAYAARVPEPGRYRTDPDVPADREPPRRITTRKYRLDDLGFTVDRRSQVFTVAVAPLPQAETPLQLTEGDYDHAQPAWSPDGALIAVVAARHEQRDEDMAQDVFVVPADGGDLRQLTDSSIAASHPAFSRDGSTVFFCSPTDIDYAGRNTGLWSASTSGSGQAARLHSDPERDDLDALLGTGGLRLLVDDGAVTAPRLSRGAVQLVRYPIGGGAAAALIDGPRQVHGYDRTPDGEVTVAVVSHDNSSGELVVVRDGAERTVTDFGAQLAEAAALHRMQELDAQSADGASVHGWVVKPDGDGPFPVLLLIHGGPFTQYGWNLFDETQIYAGAGYAVVMGNPRGSSGYGEAHGRAIVGALGELDGQDLLALLDAALEDPELDGERVGVLGGSYGGFMTTWLAARTDRFAAGISERAVNAWDSFTGSSDVGWFLTRAYCGDDPQRQRAQSPLTYADDISIPMLLIHSEHDWRCPVEQAQRLFERLKRNGCETELLLFPGEGHELSRSGLPSHRTARFEAILEWWERHLKPGATARRVVERSTG